MSRTERAIGSLDHADSGELAAVNGVICSAIESWPLPERLKRLSLTVLCYDLSDLEELDVLVSRAGRRVTGVAAWDAGIDLAGPAGERSALLHGLYVVSDAQRCGIGRRLQRAVTAAALARGFRGMYLKAERVSRGYFEACGYTRADGTPCGLDYPYVYWRRLGRAA